VTPDELGAITRTDETHAVVCFERHLPADIHAVFAAITDPGQLQLWLCRSEVDARTGGYVQHWFGDGPAEICSGRVTAWQPPTLFEYEWRFPGEPDSVVRWDLSSDGEGTRLRLEHRLLGEKHAAGYGAGWHAHLDGLDAVVKGVAVPSWDDVFAAVRASYVVPD
jgi:uncharacterized protein YndB with AHSA1/START domain